MKEGEFDFYLIVILLVFVGLALFLFGDDSDVRTSPSSCMPYGDLTGDDIVDLDDILYMLGAFSNDDPNVFYLGTDIFPCESDGITDLDDILSLLFAFSGGKVCADGCAPVCGDSFIEGDEECEDNNNNQGDACNNCQLTYCGDGIVQDLNGEGDNEECDDGDDIESDGCYLCEIEAAVCNNNICEVNEVYSCPIDCGATACISEEVCGNGFDDNCNGDVDENCIEAVSCRDPATTLLRSGKTYYLTQDIEIDSGICFFVNADDITLDFQGHTITLIDETPTAGAIGVVANGKKNLVIKNGFIRGFPTGMRLTDVQNSKVENMDVTTTQDNNLLGVEVSGMGNIIIDNKIYGNSDGLKVSGSDMLVIGNEIYDNSKGIVIDGEKISVKLDLLNNRVHDNDIGVLFLESELDEFTFNTFRDNELFDILCESVNGVGEFSDNQFDTIVGCPLEWYACIEGSDCGTGMKCEFGFCISDFSPRCDPFFSSEWSVDGGIRDEEVWDSSNLNAFLDVVPLEGAYALQAKGDSNPGRHTTQRWVQENLDSMQVIGGTVHVNFVDTVFDGATDMPFIGFYNARFGYIRDLTIAGLRRNSHGFIYLKGYQHSNSVLTEGYSNRFVVEGADYVDLADPWPDKSVRVDWFTTPTYNLFARVDKKEWRKIGVGDNQVPFNILSAGWISSRNGGNVKIRDVALYDENCVPEWVLEN